MRRQSKAAPVLRKLQLPNHAHKPGRARHLRTFAFVSLLLYASVLGRMTFGQERAAPSFYPLAVGNFWLYLEYSMMSVPDTITIEAYGDTLIEGQRWVQLHRWSHWYDWHGYYVERIDTGGDVLGRNAGSTYLKWRLSDTSATFWQAAGGVVARFDSCVADDYIGVRGRILYANYWAPEDTAASMVDAFGEGVGLLQRGWYGCCIDGFPPQLAGARIDGKAYGILGSGYALLPLQVGNFWEYRDEDVIHPTYLRMTVVGDTAMPNGRDYYILDGSLFPEMYLRTEGSSVFGYAPVDSIEYKLFDGHAMLGDTMGFFKTPIDGGIVLEGSEFDSSLYSSKWTFMQYMGPPDVWLMQRAWDFRDSLGVIRIMMEPGVTYFLHGARIGGDTLGTVVSVGERVGAPAELPYLRRNYPNPFNMSTNIVYELPLDTHVYLEVFDLLGQHVGTLYDGEQRSGAYLVEFSANGLSSGTYIYRLRAGSVTLARTLMILR